MSGKSNLEMVAWGVLTGVVVGAGVGVGLRTCKRPIWTALYSVNQRLPSGPRVRLCGELLAVGRRNSAMAPPGVIRPSLLAPGSVNQRLPSGPRVILPGY